MRTMDLAVYVRMLMRILDFGAYINMNVPGIPYFGIS